MSIYPLARVWDHSQQRGTPFVLLLAIADRADELGVAWAGTAWLAGRARLERRQTIRVIQSLEQAQELIVVRSKRENGINIVNHYIVTVGAPPEIIQQAYVRINELLAIRGSVVHDTSVQDDTRGSGRGDTRGSGSGDTRVVAGMSHDPYSDPLEKSTFSPSALWSLALGDLEMQMTRAAYRRHLENTTATLAGDELTIHVRQGSDQWLAARFNELISRTVTGLAGRPLTISYKAS